MTDRFDDDFVEDLYDESEFEMFDDDDFDEWDEDFYDDEESFEADYFEDEYDVFAEFDDFNAYDDYDAYDDFEEDEAEDEFADAMAYALGAEDTDEFLKKLWGGIKKVGRKIFRGVKKVAPVLSRVSRFIPGPYGALLSKGLGMLRHLRYEGASEDEALEAFAELAAYDEAVVPVVSALAVKSLAKGKTKNMSHAKRKKLVKDITKATKQLIKNSQSPKAVRAVPRIVMSVKKSSSAKRTPLALRPVAAKKVIKKVARNPRLTRKLAKPSLKGKRIMKKAVRAA